MGCAKDERCWISSDKIESTKRTHLSEIKQAQNWRKEEEDGKRVGARARGAASTAGAPGAITSSGPNAITAAGAPSAPSAARTPGAAGAAGATSTSRATTATGAPTAASAAHVVIITKNVSNNRQSSN